MDLSFFGYKLNVQILILIGVIYLITLVHTITGCCRYSLLESFDRMKNGDIYGGKDRENSNQDMSSSEGSEDPSPVKMKLAKNIKGNVQNSEGFSGMNSKNGESTPFDFNKGEVVNTSSWFSPDMSVSSGKSLSDGVKKFLDRKQQPLENGQMNFLANSEFKPDCCPSTYSTSSGCWCGTSKDYNYLVMRGGNNVPYSKY